MELIQSIAVAILPPLYVIYFIYKNDIYEKEPHKLLIKTFIVGCFVVVPALVLESIFDEDFFHNVFLHAMIGVSLAEEGSKLIFLRYYNYKSDDFNEPYDGIVYAVVISMGFALVENIFYVLGNPGIEISVGFLRMFTAIPLHATCGVIMGYYMGIAKMNNAKLVPELSAIFFPVLIHGFYDYFLFAGLGVIYSLLIVAIAFYFSNKAIKIHQSSSPFKTS